jgi:hypothetical protein
MLDDRDVSVHRIDPVEDKDRLLAEALAHAEHQEERHRVRFPDRDPRGGRWKTPTALVLFVVAALLAAFPTSWMPTPLPPVPSPLEIEWGLRVDLYLQTAQIEVFRAREGRLPTSLAELPVRVPGLRFVRSNGRVFQLVARRADGSALVYDSAHPAPGMKRGVGAWLGIGVP